METRLRFPRPRLYSALLSSARNRSMVLISIPNGSSRAPATKLRHHRIRPWKDHRPGTGPHFEPPSFPPFAPQRPNCDLGVRDAGASRAHLVWIGPPRSSARETDPGDHVLRRPFGDGHGFDGTSEGLRSPRRGTAGRRACDSRRSPRVECDPTSFGNPPLGIRQPAVACAPAAPQIDPVVAHTAPSIDASDQREPPAAR